MNNYFTTNFDDYGQVGLSVYEVYQHTNDIKYDFDETFTWNEPTIRKQKFTFPVTFCGQNQKMPNEVAVADLYFDPDTLNELSDTELLEQISGGGTAIRKVRINKSLPVMPSDQIPNIGTFLDIPYDQLEERARKIQENVKLQTRVSELLASNQINYPPPKYLEQSVYSGFPSDADDLWMERFHSLPWEERSKLLDGFEDSRYKAVSYTHLTLPTILLV